MIAKSNLKNRLIKIIVSQKYKSGRVIWLNSAALNLKKKEFPKLLSVLARHEHLENVISTIRLIQFIGSKFRIILFKVLQIFLKHVNSLEHIYFIYRILK